MSNWIRALAYDSPVLAMRARTRPLKSACLVIVVPRGPSRIPQRPFGEPRDRQRSSGREVDLPLPPWVTRLGRVAGGSARTDATAWQDYPTPIRQTATPAPWNRCAPDGQ